MEEPGKGLSGGMNVFLRGLLRGFSGRGIATDVLTRATGDAVELSTPFPGIRIFHVPCGWKNPPTRRSAFESLDAFILRCRRLMREERIAPRVVSAHYWMSGVAARRLAEAPMVLAYHTVEARKVPPGGLRRDPLAGIRRKEEERLAEEAVRVVFFSEYDLAETAKGIPSLPGKGVVIPPGVEDRFRRVPSREVARAFVGLPGDRAVLLLAGRGDAGKNAKDALAAFRSVRRQRKGRVLLLVAGQRGAAAGDVTFLGPVPHGGMPMLFAAADGVVCPSRYESFGLVQLEALASGAPVIVPEGTYWGEEVRAEGGGLVYDPEDPAGLSGAIRRLLSDPALRARLSLEGPRAAAPFTWEKCTASWEALLASASRSRSPRRPPRARAGRRRRCTAAADAS